MQSGIKNFKLYKAVDDYKLIEEGDHIAVGISGGKDSLSSTRLPDSDAFIRRNSHSRQSPSIWDMTSFDTPLHRLCEELKVPYHIVKTEIARILVSKMTACRTKQSRDLRVRCAPKCQGSTQ